MIISPMESSQGRRKRKKGKRQKAKGKRQKCGGQRQVGRSGRSPGKPRASYFCLLPFAFCLVPTGTGFPRLITWGLEAAPAEITSIRTTEIVRRESIEASVAPVPVGCKLRKYPAHSRRSYASK